MNFLYRIIALFTALQFLPMNFIGVGLPVIAAVAGKHSEPLPLHCIISGHKKQCPTPGIQNMPENSGHAGHDSITHRPATTKTRASAQETAGQPEIKHGETKYAEIKHGIDCEPRLQADVSFSIPDTVCNPRSGIAVPAYSVGRSFPAPSANIRAGTAHPPFHPPAIVA